MKYRFLFVISLSLTCVSAQTVDSILIKKIDSLIQISRALTGQRDFDKAVEVNAAAEKLALEKLGKESAAYGSCCFNRGNVSHSKGDHPEAEKWYLESKSIRENVLGKEHPLYAATLNNLANLYSEMGNYQKAEQIHLETKAIRENILGTEHLDYAASLTNLAVLYMKMGNYEKVEPLCIKANAINKNILGMEHPEYARSLNNLAKIYMDLGNYKKAEPLYLETKTIQEKVLGKEHPDYAQSLNNLAVLYMQMGNFEKAEQHNLESIAIREKILGKEHPDYASSLDNLANLYSDMGKYHKAEPLYIESKAIREKVLGTKHPNYAGSLNNLANLYKRLGTYEKAEPLYLEAIAIREKVWGKEHPLYLEILNNLGILYTIMGSYEKAELPFLETKNIREKVLGKEHPFYAGSVDNLANLYSDMGNYEKAELLYLEAKAIREKVLGKDHPDYAGSLNNLAILYMDMGYYEKAEPFYIEAKTIREFVLGMEHPKYAISLDNLAVLYRYMGYYEKAEPLFLKAKSIREKVLGNEHPNYTSSLYNLAGLYMDIGYYEKAEPLYLESKAIREKVLGKEHPDYARILSSLASLYLKMGLYEKAEPLYIESKAIREKMLGKEHPDYARILGNLATLYKSMSNYEKAEPLYIEGRDIKEKMLGKEHPDYALSLNNLAGLYMNMGNYEKAELIYLDAITIREKVLGKEHPYYAETIINLSNLYERQNQFSSSEPLIKEGLTLQQDMLVKAPSFLSEKELTKYVNTFQKSGSDLNAFLLARIRRGNFGNLPAMAFNHALFHKGFLLTSTTNLKTPLTSSPQSAEINLRLKSYRHRLSIEYAKPTAERKDVAELEEKANDAEKELARSVVGYAEAIRQVKWEEVQTALPQSAMALEFVQFQVNFPQKTDSVQYAVLLLRSDAAQPIFIPLFEEKEVEDLLHARQQRKSDYLNNLYAWAERDTIKQMESGRLLSKLGGQKQSLYELIWEKIEDSGLEDVKTIYYSPSGILHRINMDAIAIDENQLLSDRYQLIAVNSTRQIVTGNTDDLFTQSKDAIVYGGIQFEADTTQIIPQDESEYPLLATRSLAAIAEDTTLRGGTWQYLHWTQKEAEVISSTLSKGRLNAEHRSGLEATEEGFKTMGQLNNPSPRVLHIATHGFFFPDPEQKTATSLDDQTVFKWSDNPMIRSGLILAGGNYAWQNGKPVSPEKEDGILTAYEISQMNLSNTELVVLSACETGLGDIQGNEGVYGLQRAFKIAGAKYLIMSLWQVPDRETMEFMTTFYKNWLDGKMAIPEAFRKTQGEMRERFGDVYSWGAFVLLE